MCFFRRGHLKDDLHLFHLSMTLRQEATAEKERPKSMRYTRLIVKQTRDTGIKKLLHLSLRYRTLLAILY